MCGVVVLTAADCQMGVALPFPGDDDASASRCIDQEVVDILMANTAPSSAGQAAAMLRADGPFGCTSERNLVEFLDAVDAEDFDVRLLVAKEK